MTAPAWYNDGKKLFEGETYAFDFIKLVPLSDHMNYMLMEDPYGIRHLVPYEFYLRYNLQPGDVVHCRVDKINCTGRVYLEPAHPQYQTGSVERFSYVGISQEKQKDGDKDTEYSVLVVADIFGNEIRVDMPAGYSVEPVNGSVLCKIEGFKKGKPLLSLSLPDQEA